jgi:hypothetical protein
MKNAASRPGHEKAIPREKSLQIARNHSHRANAKTASLLSGIAGTAQ